MGLIFLMSAQAKSDVPHHSSHVVDWGLKKSGHLLEYGILALLLWRAITGSIGEKASPWHAWVIPLVCLVFAATDEYHQSFVPGRGSSASDVMIDALGIAVALGGMSLLLARRVKHPSWFHVRPCLNRFLDQFLPLRPAPQGDSAEQLLLMDRQKAPLD